MLSNEPRCFILLPTFLKFSGRTCKVETSYNLASFSYQCSYFFNFSRNKKIQEWHVSWIYQSKNGQSRLRKWDLSLISKKSRFCILYQIRINKTCLASVEPHSLIFNGLQKLLFCEPKAMPKDPLTFSDLHRVGHKTAFVLIWSDSMSFRGFR